MTSTYKAEFFASILRSLQSKDMNQGFVLNTDFYFETPFIYTLKQIITMYLENRIGIKGECCQNWASAFSQATSQIFLRSSPFSVFLCGDKVIRNFIFQTNEISQKELVQSLK